MRSKVSNIHPECFPNYGSSLTSFEDKGFIQDELTKLRGDQSTGRGWFGYDRGSHSSIFSQRCFQRRRLFPGRLDKQHATFAQRASRQSGAARLLTYSCINCQRTLPYLRAWNEKYADKGLVIIGVHAPEFEFEKTPTMFKAVADFGLTYPVVQDNNFATWRAYNNHYWPAKYFYRCGGEYCAHHFGEGDYDGVNELFRNCFERQRTRCAVIDRQSFL